MESLDGIGGEEKSQILSQVPTGNPANVSNKVKSRSLPKRGVGDRLTPQEL